MFELNENTIYMGTPENGDSRVNKSVSEVTTIRLKKVNNCSRI